MEIKTHEVLAGAYRGKRLDFKATLTHSSADGGVTALCKGVKEHHLCDEYGGDSGAPPTCPKCLAKDPRFAK